MASTSTQSSSRPSSRSRRKTAENWDDDFEFALPAWSRPTSSQASQKENALVKPEPPSTPKSSVGRGTPDSHSSWSDSPPNSPIIVKRRDKPSLTLSSSPRTTNSEAADLPLTASTASHPLLPHDTPLAPTVRHPSGSSSKNKLINRHPSSSFTPMSHVDASSSSFASYANRSTPQLRHAPSVEVMPPPPVPSRRPGSRGQVRVSGIPFSPSQDDMREGKKKGFWKQFSGTPREEDIGHRRRRSSSVGSPTKDGEAVPPLPPLPPNVRSSSSSTSVTSNSSQNPSVLSGTSQNGPTSILRRSTSSLSHSGKTPPTAYNRPVTPSKAFSRGFHLPSPINGSPYRPSAESHSASSLPYSSSFHDVAQHDSDTETEPDGPTPRRKRIRPVSAAPAPRYDSSQPNRPDARPGTAGTASATGFTTSTLRRISSISKKHGRRLSGGFKFGTTSSTSSSESKPLETVLGSPSKPPTHRPEPSTEIDLRNVRAESVSAPNSSFRTAPTSTLVSTSEALQVKTDKQRRRQSWNDFVIPTKVLERQRELKQEIGAVKKFAGGLERVGRLIDFHASLRGRIPPAKVDMFESLEMEFGQWWEMATVLIEVGATGTGSEGDMSPRSRRITLASDEAKQAGELLRTGDLSFGPRNISMPDPGTIGPGTFPEQWRASTGRQDLSKRQLEVLRTMLRTPVPPTATMLRLPITPQRQNDISFPSPSDSDYLGAIPSPETASSLAQPKRPGLKARRSSKAGLAGLKDFLRSLKGNSPDKSSRSPTKSAFSRDSRETTPASPLQPDLPTSRTSLSISGSGGFVNISPPRRIPSPEKAPKRPSLRNIFRTSSGNWSELVRPPQTPPIKSELERRSSRSSRKSQESDLGDPGLPRKSRMPKTPTSAFEFSPPWKSPARIELTASDTRDTRDKTVRPRNDKRDRRSQVIGLGNPGSPAERTGLPGHASPIISSGPNGPARGERGVVVSNPDTAAPKEVDGMTRSASAPMVSEAGDDMVVALTPENLPVLLEYLRQCEAKLGEWKVKVERGMAE